MSEGLAAAIAEHELGETARRFLLFLQRFKYQLRHLDAAKSAVLVTLGR